MKKLEVSVIPDREGQLSLAHCLAFLASELPDLATVVDVWADLPEPIRTGIVAMVEGVKRSR